MPKHKHHSEHHHSHHDGHHHSSHSHKNVSHGGHEMHGNSGPDYSPIRENHDPKPPAGASNSYERVREKIDRHDSNSLSKRPYTREKMMNK